MIHGAILKEAMVGAEAATAQFIEFATALEEQDVQNALNHRDKEKAAECCSTETTSTERVVDRRPDLGD